MTRSLLLVACVAISSCGRTTAVGLDAVYIYDSASTCLGGKQGPSSSSSRGSDGAVGTLRKEKSLVVTGRRYGKDSLCLRVASDQFRGWIVYGPLVEFEPL